MQPAGVICEYNPFHAGHARHLRDLRERSGSDTVICLMSGEFTQRGEAAVCDKWTRARMALEHGADVVLELPFVYAVQSAREFALGAVRTLDALGCSFLGFGAETDDVACLKEAAAILQTEPDAYRERLKAELKKGGSYARASRTALGSLLPGHSREIAEPNAMLAIQYLRALRDIGSSMEPVVSRRPPGSHCARTVQGGFPGGAAIRAALKDRSLDRGEVLRGAGVPLDFEPVFGDQVLFLLISSRLRNADPALLAETAGLEPGLAERILHAVRKARTWSGLLDACTSRRFTESRIRRALLNMYFGLTDTFLRAALMDGPGGVQLLGVRRGRTDVLGWLAKNSAVPVAPSPARLPPSAVQDFGVLACDTYGLLLTPARPAGQDYLRRLQAV